MKRRWYKWFGLAVGLLLCVEACMLLVEAPDDSSTALRYRISDWFDRLFRPAPVFVTGRIKVVATADLESLDENVVNVIEDDLAFVAQQGQPPQPAHDWPMFGGTTQRNMVARGAKTIPTDWSVEEGKVKNVKWTAELGTKSYGGPIVADGKVFFGTNNGNPRDPKVKGPRAVLMCFNEADGKFLWQAVHDIPADPVFDQMRSFGLVSTPCVDGKRHYYVTPGCEVICADNATGKTVWSYDMMKQQNVVPYHCCNCSPLIVDDLLMVMTGNGSDDQGKITSPKAPSFMAFDKTTGKPAWQSNLPGEKIIEGQWSNPTVAVVGGKKQVIFAGGDCWLYSLDVKTGAIVWKCNCNPRRDQPNGDKEFNPYFVATPVVHEGRCFIGLGVYPGDHPSPPRYGYLLCLDVAGKGDVSPQSLDSKDPANKGSALVWSFGGPITPVPKKGRRAHFGRTISTCAVHDGLVYISEEPGYMYCLDAKTGQRYWEDDLRSPIWSSPLYADGKVFVATEDGAVNIYEPGKVMKKINTIDMGEGIHSTPVVANGVLYVSTWSKLFAIAEKK